MLRKVYDILQSCCKKFSHTIFEPTTNKSLSLSWLLSLFTIMLQKRKLRVWTRLLVPKGSFSTFSSCLQIARRSQRLAADRHARWELACKAWRALILHTEVRREQDEKSLQIAQQFSTLYPCSETLILQAPLFNFDYLLTECFGASDYLCLCQVQWHCFLWLQ